MDISSPLRLGCYKSSSSTDPSTFYFDTTSGADSRRAARHSFTIRFPSVGFGNPSSLAATAHRLAIPKNASF